MSAPDPARESLDLRGDALDASLRRAWRALPPPEPDAPSADPAEEAAATWLRAAWRRLEAPQAEPPPGLRRRGGRLVPFALAAGASALFAAAVLALVLLLRERATTHTAEIARAGVETPVRPIAVAAIDEGRMELRSGPVRLILLDEWTEAPAPRADAR